MWILAANGSVLNDYCALFVKTCKDPQDSSLTRLQSLGEGSSLSSNRALNLSCVHSYSSKGSHPLGNVALKLWTFSLWGTKGSTEIVHSFVTFLGVWLPSALWIYIQVKGLSISGMCSKCFQTCSVPQSSHHTHYLAMPCLGKCLDFFFAFCDPSKF